MKKFGRCLALFLISTVFLSLNASIINAAIVDEKIEGELEKKPKVSVIVALKDDYGALRQYAKQNLMPRDVFEAKKMMIKEQQEGVLEDLEYEGDKIKIVNVYSTINGFSAKVDAEGLEELKNNPNVKQIYYDRPVHLLLSDSKNVVNASKAWSLVYNGQNITGKHEAVCIIDTGVDYNHANFWGCFGLGCKVIGGYDYANSDDDPMDDHGHGTHVAGIIASNDTAYTGIAPDAKIVALKMFNSAGSGTTSDLISSIDWCVNNATKFNISAISMSLGTSELFSTYCDDENTLLTSSIANAISKNISVIAATGNSGSTTGIASPACIANVTSVGAVDKNNAISYNRNSITDLLAPGVSITSTQKGGGFVSQSGTSMAAPHVVGAFVLLRQYKKLESSIVLTPAEIQDALNDTGKQIDDNAGSGATFSRITILSALASLDILSPIINITFTNPANNSNTTNKSVFVNITSTETLSASLLEINGTNHTMDGGGLNWHINKSLTNGTYNYKVYGSDFGENTAETDSRIVIILNNAPNIVSFFPNRSDINIIEPNNQTFNITNEDPDGDTLAVFWYKNKSLESNSNEFNFTGSFSAFGFYNVTVIISDGILIDQLNWDFTINNTNQLSSIVNLIINSTDLFSRTNGTLQGFFSFTDADGDAITNNETMWYNNSDAVVELSNYTIVAPNYTRKNQNWTFSVSVFDGINWSGWINSSILRINNGKPLINIADTSITIRGTETVNISLNSSDIDNDILNYSINFSFFSLINNNYIWTTNLTNVGNYNFNITVDDTEDIDSIFINITVLDSIDSDSDGNPDFNDPDDDNDGILDGSDFLIGNISSINSALPLTITINETSNTSKIFNGTNLIKISNNSDVLVEFNWTFNSSNTLNLYNLTINKTANGSSAILIKGINLKNTNFRKAVSIDKLNATTKSVCIKDADNITFDDLSSNCNSYSEILIACDNETRNGYTCLDAGNSYKISGLNNSAVKELCVDSDGDGYGNGCTLGGDCDDFNSGKNTDCSSPGDSPSGGGGSGSGGGGGGGSGSGGGGAFYVCNQDWKCGEWSECANNQQARSCEFVKVPQHVQNEPCPDSSKSPEATKDCAEIKKEISLEASSNETIKDTAINTPILNKTIQKEPKKPPGITGFAVQQFEQAGNKQAIPAIIFIILFTLLIFYKQIKNKNKK